MLEVKNLTKIYQSKNGVQTRALDGVTLRFPERGMVFLLGKSGSGKSTLLNVCGGLDDPTSGEIVVKGRSSKKFSQSDFDSYRNTYVGFIFQEYNILNEFTVEENIALALELQGKPKDKKAIADLLEQVDLKGFAKRKPNTLSGGQKQRIAIARALVKSPEIIMADEPTGALDSATGKQVFDTLKKLSEDKLVIVVSHDREFAELYADRIIELKDGKILTDVTKTEHKQQPLSENIDVIGDVLCVKRGANLDDAEFAKIREFLGKAEGDVIIAGGERDVTNFKKVRRITEIGAKEVVDSTDESRVPVREYTKEESRFIRSKLPLKHAARIGVSGLKTKPVRLFFTILLCLIAFTLFGLLSTLSFYDSAATFKQTLRDSDAEYITLAEQYKIHVKSYQNGELEYEYDMFSMVQFSEEALTQLRAKYGEGVFGAAQVRMQLPVRSTSSSYWIAEIDSIAYLPEGHALRSRINGQYPTAKNEICISSYMAQVICESTLVDETGKTVELGSTQDVLGKTLSINGTKYKVVGILDSGAIDPKYEVLKNDDTTKNGSLLYTYQQELSDGLHLLAFLSTDGVQELSRQFGYAYGGKESMNYDRRGQLFFEGATDEKEGNMMQGGNAYYAPVSLLDKNGYIPLADNADGIVVSVSRVCDALRNKLWAEQMEIENLPYEDRTEAHEAHLEALYDLSNQIETVLSDQKKAEDGEGNHIYTPYTTEEREAAFKTMLTKAEQVFGDITLEANFAPYDERNQMRLDAPEKYVVRGVFIPEQIYSSEAEVVYLPDAKVDAFWALQKQSLEWYEETSTAYKGETNGLYNKLYLPFDRSDAMVNTLWEMYENEAYDENDARFYIMDSRVQEIAMVDSVVETLSKVFLYVGLGFALFAILLFSNFISVSISQKKKEIGILRAVGARSLDVFKIFFAESFTIAAICTALSVIACTVLCRVLNTSIGASIGASLFVFGFGSIAILIGIAILTAIIATFLPVWNAAKKKPVESIRAL